jgi:hypothetical protein
MKLYTEQEVRAAIDMAREGVRSKDGIIDTLNFIKPPINLPSDEEIRKWAEKQSEMEPTGEEEFGRVCGAKWMRDKIKGGK